MKISYDNEKKIWKSLNYCHGDVVKHFLGEVFLENVGKCEANKIIEWHYDTGRGRTMEEIYRESITVAMNLQKMGIKKGDVVVFYCMMNSKLSSLAMGCLMLGATVNFFETNFSPGMKLKAIFEKLFSLINIWLLFRICSIHFKSIECHCHFV